MIIIGYHGCDASTQKKLVSSEVEHLKPSKNPYDWLGTGAYFFVEDPDRAYEFAQASSNAPLKKYTASPILTPAVVGAVIDVGNIWDLRHVFGRAHFKNTGDLFIQTMREQGEKIPENKRSSEDGFMRLRNFDRAVINTACQIQMEKGNPFDAVINSFEQGTPMFEHSGVMSMSHTQIAVRNPSASIKGYFLPK
jgi:hypothetical protein